MPCSKTFQSNKILTLTKAQKLLFLKQFEQSIPEFAAPSTNWKIQNSKRSEILASRKLTVRNLLMS
jgi:hypothetical protein